ncbi:MAG: insulinase family protein [Chitinophagaceae bacterium]|nr:insulinase family protein [Chitinophagaceae bacterium]
MNRSLFCSFRFLFLLVATAFFAGGAYAQVDLSGKLPLDPKLKTGRLENGLTYYIRENKKPEQKVELRLVVNAGSINEDDDQQGLAHMAEHMAFNGTKRFKKNEIISFLQDIGVGFGNDLNAYTGFDETVYILPIPTDKPGNIEKGFQVLEDWASQVTYLDEDIDDERAVILEESRLGKGANDRMFRKIFPGLFEGSKYARRLPIGVDSIIKSFPYEAIRRFYRNWYRPDLMAVIVVGDITTAAAEEMIKKHFSHLKNPDHPRLRLYAEAPPYSSTRAITATDKEATRYIVSVNYPAFESAPSTTLGDYRHDLIELIFTSLFNQRLQERAQQENPPFVGAGADFSSYARGYKSFNLSAGTGAGSVANGLEGLMEEWERVKRYGFTPQELERAKKNIFSSYEKAFNDREKNESANFVNEYIEHFLSHSPSPGIEHEFDYVKKLLPGIELEEVNKFISRFRGEQNRFLYVMGPEPKAGQQLPSDEEWVAMLESVEKKDIAPYEETIVETELIRDMPKPGKVSSRKSDALLGTTTLKLANGVTVVLKPTDFKDDQVVMGAVRAGGKNNYGLSDKYNAEYATALVSAMGVGAFSPTDLRKALAGKSVSVTPSLSSTADRLNGSSTVKDLETLFQLTYLYLTQPRKDEALFKTYIQKNKLQYANISANPQAVFVDTLYKTLYNGNPLSPIAVPYSEYFDKISLDRAYNIYKERFGNANGMSFVFVGSFKEKDIISLIEKYIASLPSSPAKSAYADNKLRPVSGKKTLTIHKGSEQKSLIVAFYTGEAPYSEDLELKISALEEVLNIRIIEELREKIQGIYGGGVSAKLEKVPYANYRFSLQLPCGPEKVDTLLKAALKEFEQMALHGPEQRYLDKVKQQWKEQYKTMRKENGAWLTELITSVFPGSDPKRFLEYEKYVDKLTVKDVQEAARIVLNGKNQLTAILMPEAAEQTK